MELSLHFTTAQMCTRIVHIEIRGPEAHGRQPHTSGNWTTLSIFWDVSETIFKLGQHINLKVNKVLLYPYKEKFPAPWRPCFLADGNHFRTHTKYYLNKCSDQVPWRFDKKDLKSVWPDPWQPYFWMNHNQFQTQQSYQMFWPSFSRIGPLMWLLELPRLLASHFSAATSM